MAGIRGFTSWVGVVLGSTDPPRLAQFYSDLLGWEIGRSEPDWVTMVMRDADGTATRSNLAFQLETDHVPPAWPAGDGDQQMQMHLDIGVRELDAAVTDAVALGARLADVQPQEDVRVLLDLDGHPFCLYLDTDATG